MGKIVIVARDFFVAGAQNMISQLASNLNQDKYDITLIVTTMRCNNYLEKRVERAGINTIYLGKRYSCMLDRIKAFFQILAILRKIKPDVIHTHLSATIYTFPYVLMNKTKLLHTIHNLPDKDIPRITQKLLKLLIRWRKAIPVAISDTIGKEISSHYQISQEEVPVIYNPVEVNLFSHKDRISTDNALKLCVVGRLNKQKNHRMLIEAFAIARDQNKRLFLQIVGDGDLRMELERQVAEYGINDSVTFMGIRSDIQKILNEADIFVLSSTYEGLPLCLLEAMAAGLPIIAARVGGVPDIIRHNRNGLLIKSGDIKEFSDAILKLANNNNIRDAMSRNNLDDVKQYDVSVMARKYEQLYEKYVK